jgi:hypothetical protein
VGDMHGRFAMRSGPSQYLRPTLVFGTPCMLEKQNAR